MRLSFTQDGKAVTGKDLEAHVQKNVEQFAGNATTVAKEGYTIAKAIGVGIYKGIRNVINDDQTELEELRAFKAKHSK